MPYRPWNVSNTKAICPLIWGAWRPRLRRGLLQQRRIVLSVSRNAEHREGSKPPMGLLPPWSFSPMGIGEQPCRWLTWLLAIPSPSTVFPNFAYRGGDAVTSGDLVSLHSLSFLWVSRRRRRYFWRSRLPPQSFLPVGIEEARLLMPYTGDASSALYWRRLQRLILATLPASWQCLVRSTC